MKQSLFLVTLLLGSTLPSLAESFENGGLWYEVVSDKEKTLRLLNSPEGVELKDAYAEISGKFHIPETVSHNGYEWTVTEIQELTFAFNSGITEVTIPGSIKTIGNNVLSRCENLKKITMEEGVETIDMAFRYNPSDLCIVFPASVSNITTDYFGGFDGENFTISRIQFLGKTPPTISGSDIYKALVVYVPDKAVDIYRSTFSEENIRLAYKIKNSPEGDIRSFPLYDFSDNGLYYDITDYVTGTCELTFGDNPYPADITVPEKAGGYTVTGIGNSLEIDTNGGSISLPSTIRYVRTNSVEFQRVLAHSVMPPAGALSFSKRGILYVPKGAKDNWISWGNPARIAETDYSGNLDDLQTADICVDGVSYMITGQQPPTCRVSWNATNTYPESVEIPSVITHDGVSYSVNEVEENAFKGAEGVKRLILPQDVEKIVIGYNAFTEMPNLEELTLPVHLKNMSYMFGSYPRLKKITLSSDLDDVQLRDCPELTTIVCRGQRPPFISYESLYISTLSEEEQWSRLKGITAYVPASSLKLYEESGDEESGRYTYGWKILGNILPDPEQPDTRIMLNGICYLLNADGSAMVFCSDNGYSGNVTIPETINISGENYNVTSIGYKSFAGCTSLTGISIPATVVSIDDMAFDQCTSLSEIRLEDSKLPLAEMRLYSSPIKRLYVGRNFHFYNAQNLDYLEFGPEVTEISGYINLPLSTLKLPEKLEKIDGFNYSSISSIRFPDGIRSISGFSYTPLTAVEFPSSVTNINGFNYTSLATVEFPVSVRSISGFDGCQSLRNLVIPKSVTTLQGFNFCTALESVVIGKSLTDFGGFIQSGDSLKEITVGSNIIYMGEASFSKSDWTNPTLTNLHTVRLLNPNPTHEYNYSYLFRDPNPDLNIYIPVGSLDTYKNILGSSLNFIEADLSYIEEADIEAGNIYADIDENRGTCTITFGENKQQGNLDIPETLSDDRGKSFTVTAIGTAAFAGNDRLTGVTIPSTVSSIYNRAFADCTGLEEATLGSRLESMADDAFVGCESILEIVSLNPEPPVIGSEMTRAYGRPFEQAVYDNATLTVPFGSKVRYKAASGWSEFRNIVESTSGIDEIIGNDNNDTLPVLIISGGRIIINGIEDGSPVQVCSIDGRIVASTRIVDGAVENLDTTTLKGFYIIKTPASAFKIKL